jgi:hypothetical protein
LNTGRAIHHKSCAHLRTTKIKTSGAKQTLCWNQE